MGICVQAIRLLLEARRQGVSFGSTVTLGRQNYFPSDSETVREFRRAGLDPAATPGLLGDRSEPRYADAFWRALGASQLQALDASDYEGAALVHDLNRPMPAEWAAKHDVVYDGGSLEHVFQFTTALAGCMSLVKPGGRLILFTPANNQFGHGFYQFSPELFFRVFSAAQGYELERMVAVEYGPRYRRFEVVDPDLIASRVTLMNAYPVYLFVQARRVAVKPLFEVVPQQSDYMAQWRKGQPIEGRSGARPLESRSDLRRRLKEGAPRWIRFAEALWGSAWNRGQGFGDRRRFRPLD